MRRKLRISEGKRGNQFVVCMIRPQLGVSRRDVKAQVLLIHCPFIVRFCPLRPEKSVC